MSYKNPKIGVGQKVLLGKPRAEQDVIRKASHLFVPLPDHLHSQLFEGVNEHLDLVLGHLVGLEGGAKGHKDSSFSGRVHELLEIPFQRFGILQLKSTNLDYVGRILPGSMGYRMATGKKQSTPFSQSFRMVGNLE